MHKITIDCKRINKLAMLLQYTLFLHLQLLLYPFRTLYILHVIFQNYTKHLDDSMAKNFRRIRNKLPLISLSSTTTTTTSSTITTISLFFDKSRLLNVIYIDGSSLPQFAEDFSFYFVWFWFFLGISVVIFSF